MNLSYPPQMNAQIFPRRCTDGAQNTYRSSLCYSLIAREGRTSTITAGLIAGSLRARGSVRIALAPTRKCQTSMCDGVVIGPGSVSRRTPSWTHETRGSRAAEAPESSSASPSAFWPIPARVVPRGRGDWSAFAKELETVTHEMKLS